MPGLAVQAWGPLEGVVGDTCMVRHVRDTCPVQKLAGQWGDRRGKGRRFSESAPHSEVLSEEETEMETVAMIVMIATNGGEKMKIK